jgi:hypothetical protein
MTQAIENQAPRTRDRSEVRSEAERAKREAIRQRLRDTGGARLKLEVFGTVPGYHLYWENDEGSNIPALLQDGFDFVAPDEVGMANWLVADKDVEGKISKYVGTKADGSPLRAFLMKLPEDMWADREAIRQERPDMWEGAIRKGEVENVENRYKPVGHDIKVNSK